jgi:sulfur-carrier protein
MTIDSTIQSQPLKGMANRAGGGRNNSDLMVRVVLPPVLRPLCGHEPAIWVQPGTIRDLVRQLHSRYNGVRDRLCDSNGDIRGSVLLFVNDEDIRFLNHQETQVRGGDEVSIIPAFAGG